MPNGGYPLHFAIRLGDDHAIRLTGQRAEYIHIKTQADGSELWETITRIPAEAIAALMFHVGYWTPGEDDHADVLRRLRVEDRRVAPAYSSQVCLYDY